MSKEDLERLDDQGMSAWNDHDADGWVGLFADDFVIHDWTIAEPIRDKGGARQYFNAWATAFPDMQVKQTSRVVGEDAVAAEVEFTGTNTGIMVMAGNEIAATNKTVVGRGSYIAHVRGGKVTEFSAHPDAAGMMMQLGLMPQM
jgi:predicted ester cyclase